MSEDTQQHPSFSSPSYAHAVEADLRALQDSHRLAIHQWETEDPYEAPTYLQTLNLPAADIPAKLIEDRALPSYSMTLLPSTHAHYSVKPYEVNFITVPAAGYLFDLRQDQPTPAKVLRVSTHNLKSNNDVYDKDSKFQDKTIDDPPALVEFYSHYPSNDALRQKVASDPKVSEEQLNILGQDLDQPHIPGSRLYEKDILLHNEILVAATKTHIKAISIPILDPPSERRSASFVSDTIDENCREYSEIDPAERRAILELLGAAHGLDHLSKGMDLPVVFYHVNGTDKNKVTFFAQGREALTEKAYAALDVLEQHHTMQRFTGYHADKIHGLTTLVQNVLGVDMYAKIEVPPAHPNPSKENIAAIQHEGQGLLNPQHKPGPELP